MAGDVVLPSGVSLVSDPEMLVVNIVAAPTAEDLEAEGEGESGEGAETHAPENGAPADCVDRGGAGRTGGQIGRKAVKGKSV